MNIKDYTLKLLNFQEKNIVIKKVELVNDVCYVYIDQIKDVNLLFFIIISFRIIFKKFIINWFN